MTGCTETVGGQPCVGLATHPPHDPKFCAVHKRCNRCAQHHVDKALYRCQQCGAEMCVAQTVMDPDPKNRKQIRRAHERAYKKCGPVEAVAGVRA